ncbi:MAG: hypothetical protein H0U67_08395 [Gemmatimonadetes bacterium]|nr:hypothetical protein [Gemmatimonadota bacterium]
MPLRRSLLALLLAFVLAPASGEASTSAGLPHGGAIQAPSSSYAEEVYRSAGPQLLRVVEILANGTGHGGAARSPTSSAATSSCELSGIRPEARAAEGVRPFAERLPYYATAPPAER